MAYYIRENLSLISKKRKNSMPKMARPPTKEAKKVDNDIPWFTWALPDPLSIPGRPPPPEELADAAAVLDMVTKTSGVLEVGSDWLVALAVQLRGEKY